LSINAIPLSSVTPTAEPAPASPAAPASSGLQVAALATPAPTAPATQAQAVSVATAAAAIRQSALAPLLADLAQAVVSPSTPAPVQAAAANVLALQTPLDPPPSAADLRQAVASSGLFLEAQLGSAATPAPTPASDLKAALLVLQSLAKAWADSASVASSATPGGANGGTPPSPQSAPPGETPALPSSQPGTVASIAVANAAAPVPPAPAATAAPASPSQPLQPAPAPALAQGSPQGQGQSQTDGQGQSQAWPQGRPNAPPAAVASPDETIDTATSSSPSGAATNTVATGSPTPTASAATDASAPASPAAKTTATPSTARTPASTEAPASLPASLPSTGAQPLAALPQLLAGGLGLTEASAADGASQTDAAAGGAAAQLAAETAAPPPFRGGPTRGQRPTPPSLDDDIEPAQAARRLASGAAGAVARQELHQIASLPTPEAGRPAAATNPRWMFELPFTTAQGSAVAQFEISRDGGGGASQAGQATWRARFSIDLEPLGPVHAQVALTGTRAAVGLWAERPATAAQLRAQQAVLSANLEEEAFAPAISVHLGAPPHTAPRAGRFLDQAS
jgi:hypothetical protein